MAGILTIGIGKGAAEEKHSIGWISMYHTKAVSKLNKEILRFAKEAGEIGTKSKKLSARVEEINTEFKRLKDSKEGIEDTSVLTRLVEEKKLITEQQLEMSEEITEKTDSFWDRKLSLIHGVFQEKFDLISLEKSKSPEEINEIFQQVYDFANGIIRKN